MLAVDSSFNPTVTTPSGAVIAAPQTTAWRLNLTGTITDSNGNQISGVTDTLGLSAITIGGTANAYTYTYPSPTNPANLVGVTVNTTNYTVQTSFGCLYVLEYGPQSVSLISSIVMPDGGTYIFNYEGTPGHSGSVTGRISSITLPSGGTISFTYTGGANGATCLQGYASGEPPVLTRTTPDGVWTYTRNETTFDAGGGYVLNPFSTTTIVDPKGNTDVFTIYGDEYGLKRQSYQGSSTGTLLRTIETCYNGNAFPCNANASFALPGTRKTVRTEWPDSNGSVSQTDTLFNTVGLVTDVSEYDYGSGGPPSTPVRTTHTDYAALANNIQDRPSAVTVKDGSGHIVSQTTYGYDETTPTATSVPNHIAISGSRGNQTSVTQLIQGTTTRARTTSYYDTGIPNIVKDFNGNPTTYGYGSGSCGGAFPTSITNALNQTVSATWDCNGAIKTSQTDANNQTTSFVFGDPYFWRPTATNYPDGGQVATTYNLASPPWSVVRTTKLDASAPLVNTPLVNTTVYDSLGRARQTQLNSDPDPQGITYVDTSYDATGRVYSITNPYRSGTPQPTSGTTYYAYDALGRTTLVTNPDSTSTVQTDYSAFPNITVTDETGRKRQTRSDGLGRLTDVYEPNPATGSLTTGAFHTNYAYYPLDNLQTVTQYGDGVGPVRSRSFSYDSISRLTLATNPESGTVGYTYDNNGNLLSKTSPTPNQNGIATTTLSYCYDPLDRITSKAYTQQSCPMTSPMATYAYDQGTNGVGRRTSMNDSRGQITWTYDVMGRAASLQQTVSGSVLPGGNPVSKNMSYSYWLDGSLKSITYPSGRVVNYHINATGRTDWVYKTDAGSGQTIRYAHVNSFHPFGQPKEVLMGNVSGCYVGALGEFNYNKRLQPSHILYTTNTDSTSAQNEVQNSSCPATNNSSDLMHHWYSYADSFNNGPPADNGNVSKVSNCIDSNRSQNFTYDGLNRIQTASTDGPNWGEQFTIDPWGNLTNIAPTKGTGERFNAAPATTKNQLNGPSYDSAGNQLSGMDPFGGNVTYTYDAENRVANMSGNSAAAYIYDGDGNRVVKNLGGNGTLYWRGADGAVLGESDLSGNLTAEYVFFNGQRIARTDNPTSTSTASLKYYLSDHLVSTSMITDATFSTVLQDEDYFPYGGEVAGGGDNSNHYSFTGDEHDAESNLEHTQFRQLGTTQGRWLSPDPYLGSIDLTNPQSLNRYVYVLNDPEGATDPDGLQCTVFAGINTKPGTWDFIKNDPDLGIDNIVYPYSGGKVEGVANVVAQGLFGDLGSTRTAAAAFNNFDPAQSNTAFIVSGSSQALGIAFMEGLLTRDAKNSVNAYVDISGGNFLSPDIGGSNRHKFHGTGPVDLMVTMSNILQGGHGEGLPCTHGQLYCQLYQLKLKHPEYFANCTGKRTDASSSFGGGPSSGYGGDGTVQYQLIFWSPVIWSNEGVGFGPVQPIIVPIPGPRH